MVATAAGVLAGVAGVGPVVGVPVALVGGVPVAGETVPLVAGLGGWRVVDVTVHLAASATVSRRAAVMVVVVVDVWGGLGAGRDIGRGPMRRIAGPTIVPGETRAMASAGTVGPVARPAAWDRLGTATQGFVVGTQTTLRGVVGASGAVGTSPGLVVRSQMAKGGTASGGTLARRERPAHLGSARLALGRGAGQVRRAMRLARPPRVVGAARIRARRDIFPEVASGSLTRASMRM